MSWGERQNTESQTRIADALEERNKIEKAKLAEMRAVRVANCGHQDETKACHAADQRTAMALGETTHSPRVVKGNTSTDSNSSKE